MSLSRKSSHHLTSTPIPPKKQAPPAKNIQMLIIPSGRSWERTERTTPSPIIANASLTERSPVPELLGSALFDEDLLSERASLRRVPFFPGALPLRRI